MKKSLKILVLALSGTVMLSLSSCSLRSEGKLKINPSDFDINNSVYTIKNNIGKAPTLCVYDYNNDKILEAKDLEENYEYAVVYGKNLLAVQDSKNEKDFTFKINSDIQFEQIDYCSIFDDILNQEGKYILSYDYEENNLILKEMGEGRVDKLFSVKITKDDDSVSGAINIDEKKVYLCYTDGTKTILDTYDFSGELIEKKEVSEELLRLKLKYMNKKLFLLEVSVFETTKGEYLSGKKIYEKNEDSINTIMECKDTPIDMMYIEKSKEYIVLEGMNYYSANIYDENYSLLKNNTLSNLVNGGYLRSIILDNRISLLFDQGEVVNIDFKTNEIEKIELEE